MRLTPPPAPRFRFGGPGGLPYLPAVALVGSPPGGPRCGAAPPCRSPSEGCSDWLTRLLAYGGACACVRVRVRAVGARWMIERVFDGVGHAN
nr:MAG TPA: hypothetical protein [Caudoviricetes sp.]